MSIVSSLRSLPKVIGDASPLGAAAAAATGDLIRANDVGGRYCQDCRVAEIQPNPAKRAGVKPYALAPENANGLWAKSEEMVGERF